MTSSISINDPYTHHLSFDMITKTSIYHGSHNDTKDIDSFINKYLQQNINQNDHITRWTFVQDYIKNLSNQQIDLFVQRYVNDKIIQHLTDMYFKIYDHIEFVFEKHINMIEKESNENVKRYITTYILFNSITYSSFLY